MGLRTMALIVSVQPVLVALLAPSSTGERVGALRWARRRRRDGASVGSTNPSTSLSLSATRAPDPAAYAKISPRGMKRRL